MIWDKQNRRMFLQGSGKFLLAIPFLPSLLSREARAQAAPALSRYVAFCMDYGYSKHNQWYPTNNLPTNVLSGGGHYQSLSSLQAQNGGLLSPIFQDMLNPYLSMTNMIRGLDFDNATRLPHSYGHRLGHYGEGIVGVNRTIDQVLNADPSFNPGGQRDVAFAGYHRHPGAGTKFVGSYGGNQSGPYQGLTHPIYISNNGANKTPNNPQQLFDRLFLGFQAPPPGTGGGSGNTTPALSQNRDILSRVFTDYKRVYSSRKISSENKKTLESVGDRLSDLIKNLASQTQNPPPQANICSPNLTNLSVTRSTYAQEKQMNRSFAKVLSMAMACDVTRSSVVFAGADPLSFYTLGAEIGVVGNVNFHANVTHFPFERRQSNTLGHVHIEKYNRLNVQNFLIPLLEEMSSIRDPHNNETMLHNSIVHVNNEHALVHSRFCVPSLLIGKAGGNLKTGHLIDYSDRSKPPVSGSGGAGHSKDINNTARFTHTWPGISYKKLCATIASKLGLAPNKYSDMTTESPLNLPNSDAA